MKRLNRGDKVYLDKEGIIGSQVNQYIECSGGIVEMYEYKDCSGYGSNTRLFLCRDTKHESVSIIMQDRDWETPLHSIY